MGASLPFSFSFLSMPIIFAKIGELLNIAVDALLDFVQRNQMRMRADGPPGHIRIIWDKNIRLPSISEIYTMLA